MSPRISILRDALLLTLWGAMVLWLSLTEQLATYLYPALQPYTTAAGVIFLFLAIFRVRSLMLLPKLQHHHNNGCCSHSDHGEDDPSDEGYHHLHDSSGAGRLALIAKTLLLLLPLAIIFSGKATAYSVTTVQNRGVIGDLSKLPAANAAVSAAPPTSASSSGTGTMPLQIIDMLYAIQMPSYREEFEGKEVEMIGQYVPMTTGNPKGDRFQAVRMFITCCAADAKPVGITVQHPQRLTMPEMGWVKITGKPSFPMEGGRRTAILEATKVEPCPAPSEPFVY
jgi:uncharacterized repeat protein (TIGR03943 family)